MPQTLVSKDAAGNGTGGHLRLGLDASGALEAELWSVSSPFRVTAPSPITDAEWHLALVSFGSGGLVLYLDGVEVDRNLYPGGLDASSGGAGNAEPIVIGAGTDTSVAGTGAPLTDHFAGHLDEVAFFAQQIDACEARALYQAGVRSYAIPAGSVLSVPVASGLLANDCGTAGATLTTEMVDLPANGMLTFRSDGSFDYTPAPGFVGIDTFRYRCFDGTLHSNLSIAVLDVR